MIPVICCTNRSDFVEVSRCGKYFSAVISVCLVINVSSAVLLTHAGGQNVVKKGVTVLPGHGSVSYVPENTTSFKHVAQVSCNVSEFDLLVVANSLQKSTCTSSHVENVMLWT